MTSQEILKLWQRGQRVCGTLVVSTSPRWPEVVRNSGVDFVFIDTEHIPIDRQTLSWMCQTYTAMGIPPIVRIPSPNPSDACMVLDGGANGIIAPYVESVEQVRELVGATKLRPIKGKLMDAALQNPDVLKPELASYLNKYNFGNMLIVNIKSVPAIDNLDAILSVPGLDAVLIGPHDLSVSLGIPEQYRNATFDRTVRGIIERARSRQIAAGFHSWDDMELELKWIKAGANMIVHGFDIRIFANTLRTDLMKMREVFGDNAPISDTGEVTAV